MQKDLFILLLFAFELEGIAVGALIHSRVRFVSPYLDASKRAVITITAVMNALAY